jgi:hypothetical protein
VYRACRCQMGRWVVGCPIADRRLRLTQVPLRRRVRSCQTQLVDSHAEHESRRRKYRWCKLAVIALRARRTVSHCSRVTSLCSQRVGYCLGSGLLVDCSCNDIRALALNLSIVPKDANACQGTFISHHTTQMILPYDSLHPETNIHRE